MTTYFLSFLIISLIVRGNFSFLSPVYDEDANKFFDINKSLLLSCKVSEKDEKANEIKWGRQHLDNVTSNLDLTKYEIKNTIDMSSLIIQRARKADAGVYFCEYRNNSYTFNVIAKLRVKIKPSKDVCAVDGELLMLRCVGVGTKITLKWIYDKHITDVKFIRRFADDFESNILVIKKVAMWQSGSFTCEGRHDESLNVTSVVTKTIKVTVRDSYAGMFNVLKWPSSCRVFMIQQNNL